ncbi:MAG TPA: hypothetical protein VF080_03730 [Solirubrobacteraceae bacterium]
MYSSTSHHPATGPSGRWLRQRRRDHAGRERVLDLGRLFVGLTVVAFGVLYLLDAGGVLDAHQASSGGGRRCCSPRAC